MKLRIKKPKDRPETVRQAQAWTNLKNHYLAAGLCEGCAGQAAYGHQLGFRLAHDPCDACAGITLPMKLLAHNGDRGAAWLRGAYREDVAR